MKTVRMRGKERVLGLRDVTNPGLAVGATRGKAAKIRYRTILGMRKMVGVGGFEPPASWPQTRRSSLTELHPVAFRLVRARQRSQHGGSALWAPRRLSTRSRRPSAR